MKKVFNIAFLAIMGSFLFLGCSKTFEGVKEDSAQNWEATKDGTKKAWESTKEAVHKATE